MVSLTPLSALATPIKASLSLMVALGCLYPLQAQAQSAFPDDLNEGIDLTDPNNMRPLAQNSSYLSIAGAQRLMEEATNASSGENYNLAEQKLQEARQIFNQLSNFYQQLASSFSGIDSRLAEEQRDRALSTAQMRDETTYQLALVHRAQNKPELAVPLLIQIIRSQAPTRDLGKKAYQQLFEIGFVSTPFPRERGPQSSSTR